MTGGKIEPYIGQEERIDKKDLEEPLQPQPLFAHLKHRIHKTRIPHIVKTGRINKEC